MEHNECSKNKIKIQTVLMKTNNSNDNARIKANSKVKSPNPDNF